MSDMLPGSMSGRLNLSPARLTTEEMRVVIIKNNHREEGENTEPTEREAKRFSLWALWPPSSLWLPIVAVMNDRGGK
jgi:hypothetical protein